MRYPAARTFGLKSRARRSSPVPLRIWTVTPAAGSSGVAVTGALVVGGALVLGAAVVVGALVVVGAAVLAVGAVVDSGEALVVAEPAWGGWPASRGPLRRSTSRNRTRKTASTAAARNVRSGRPGHSPRA